MECGINCYSNVKLLLTVINLIHLLSRMIKFSRFWLLIDFSNSVRRALLLLIVQNAELCLCYVQMFLLTAGGWDWSFNFLLLGTMRSFSSLFNWYIRVIMCSIGSFTSSKCLIQVRLMFIIIHVLWTDCGILGGVSVQILRRGTKGNVWLWRTPIRVLCNGWYTEAADLTPFFLFFISVLDLLV